MQTIGVGVGFVVPLYLVQDGSFVFGFSYDTTLSGVQFSLYKIEGKDSHKCQTAYRP